MIEVRRVADGSQFLSLRQLRRGKLSLVGREMAPLSRSISQSLLSTSLITTVIGC
jgi:hypothetical protein